MNQRPGPSHFRIDTNMSVSPAALHTLFRLPWLPFCSERWRGNALGIALATDLYVHGLCCTASGAVVEENAERMILSSRYCRALAHGSFALEGWCAISSPSIL